VHVQQCKLEYGLYTADTLRYHPNSYNAFVGQLLVSRFAPYLNHVVTAWGLAKTSSTLVIDRISTRT